MPVLHLSTEISAPPERVFDLARSIDFHQATAAATGEQAIAGITSGLITLGEKVTWQARHFGITQRLTVLITQFDRPIYFQDQMTKGVFRKMIHDHTFNEVGSDTLMVDRFEFSSPFGPIGQTVDHLILASHLKNFLTVRNALIKQAAESDEWKKYLVRQVGP